jgi:hypothetical protein
MLPVLPVVLVVVNYSLRHVLQRDCRNNLSFTSNFNSADQVLTSGLEQFGAMFSRKQLYSKVCAHVDQQNPMRYQADFLFGPTSHVRGHTSDCFNTG